MKLFKFLEIISKEQFPFRLEYNESIGEVIVIVDTFTKVIEYSFNKNGITSLDEFEEVSSTEEPEEMASKIMDLIDRPQRSWIEASSDLGIRFIYPYQIIDTNGMKHEFTGLLPDFGIAKGALITSRKTYEDASAIADLTNDYTISGLNPIYYDKYDRELFIDTFSDWGWIGDDSEKPEWVEDKVRD